MSLRLIVLQVTKKLFINFQYVIPDRIHNRKGMREEPRQPFHFIADPQARWFTITIFIALRIKHSTSFTGSPTIGQRQFNCSVHFQIVYDEKI